MARPGAGGPVGLVGRLLPAAVGRRPRPSCAAWFAERVRTRAGSPSRPTASATRSPGGRPAASATDAPACSPAPTSTPSSTAGRTTARWASSPRSRRSTSCASAGFAPARPIGIGGLRGGGGLALRPRLPRLAAGHRRDDLGRRPASCATATASSSPTRSPTPGWTRRPGCCRPRPGRHLRRAARRAGPRPRRPRRRRRAGQRDLAARPLALRLRRAGQPRRHHPHGGPARPDAHLRDDRAGGQQAGPAGRRSGRPSGGSRCEPNGTNAVPSLVTAWLDARASSDDALAEMVGRHRAAGRRPRRSRRHLAGR